jgi:hypothetical protein
MSSASLIIASVHSIVTMLIIGETDGDMEAQQLLEEASKRISSGYAWFMSGILAFSVALIYHFALFNRYIETTIVGISAVGMLGGVYFMVLAVPQVQALHHVKSDSVKHLPLVVPASQIHEYAKALSRDVGIEHLSAPLLQQYIEQNARQQGGPPVALSELSKKLVDRVAQALIDKAVEEEMGKISI